MLVAGIRCLAEVSCADSDMFLTQLARPGNRIRQRTRNAKNPQNRGSFHLSASCGGIWGRQRRRRSRVFGDRDFTARFAGKPPLDSKIGFDIICNASQNEHSSVAQWQSMRLLTAGLLVRVQPEEPFLYLFNKVVRSWLSLSKPMAFNKLRLRFPQNIEKLPF